MNFGDFEKNIEYKLHKRQFRNLPEDTTMPWDRVFVTSVEMDNWVGGPARDAGTMDFRMGQWCVILARTACSNSAYKTYFVSLSSIHSLDIFLISIYCLSVTSS